jgi:8-oxo-dGTP pyrophosphatase MutT (NUDIX family)
MKYRRIGEKGSKVEGKKSAGILFTDGRAILMLKRAEGSHKGTWALPGGHARPGETEIGNAVRETKEETGLKNIPGYRFESFTSRDGHKKFTAFLYRVSDHFDVSLSEEHTDWEWVSFDDLGSKDLHPKFEENLPRYLTAIRRKVRTFSEWTVLTELILG